MEIKNRVAASDIAVFDPASLCPPEAPIEIDLAPFLHRGFVLREKEFRAAVDAMDTAPTRGRDVAVFCSTDAIVPTWAWMLVASKLDGALSVTQGSASDAVRERIARSVTAVDWSQYAGRPVVIKGCGSSVPPAAYTAALRALQGVASKVMYGEPCSAVPVWRAAKAQPARTNAAVKAIQPMK